MYRGGMIIYCFMDDNKLAVAIYATAEGNEHPVCEFHEQETKKYNWIFIRRLDQTKIHPYYTKIRDNLKLRELENEGFKRGEERGKTMNIYEADILLSLEKQFKDLKFGFLLKTDAQRLKELADIRNVAGLLFLLIENPEAFEKEET